MTFRESADQAVQSSALTFAARVASIVLVPLMLATTVGGFTIVRDHDRQIISLQARLTEIEIQRAQIIALTTRISASEAASAGIVARLEAQQAVLTRIERHLERLANGAK